MILQVFTLLGALGMFLYGMNLMSTGLQKAAGDRLRRFLEAMTSNRFKSVTTGLTITSIIQSSSATTVMVVGFVNAGLLALEQAIGVIMGANIGTTITAWMISLLGFKSDISILAVPLMALGFILSISKKERNKNFSEWNLKNINAMIDLLDKSYKIMIDNLTQNSKNLLGLKSAVDCEIEINEMRNILREEEIKRIEQNGSCYQSSVYYLDIISEIERMGDFIINISQAATKN